MSPTKDDANLLMQFMSMMRSDTEYKNAGRWFSEELNVQSYDEFKSKYPAGSQGYRNFMLYVGYYELLSTLINNNLLNGDLIFDIWGNLGWKKAEPIVKGIRGEIAWQRLFENYEFFVKKYAKWDEENPAKV